MPMELPVVESCFFCDILEGRIEPWAVVEDTDLTLVLLNGRQFEIGQCIVVPKRHVPTLFELDEPEMTAVITAAKRAAEAMLGAFDPDGILLYQNNGVGSLQEVPHFHLHVVPRQPGSDWGDGPPHLAELGRRASDPRFDHEAVDEAKRETVQQLADAWPNHAQQQAS